MLTRLQPYLALMRLDRPVGTLLLLWPTLAALWLAAEGMPPVGTLAVFVVGTFLARSAGCVINDIADRRFDGLVARTKRRPLVTGDVSLRGAIVLLVALAGGCLAVVLTLNPLTVALALVGAIVAALYPFLKRWTHLPQAGLGVAFSWGIPMAFAATTGTVNAIGWLLFAASLTWVVAYDTMYAMVDRDDDRIAGIKSTAVLLGHWDRAAIALLQALTIGMLYLVGVVAGAGLTYYAGIVAMVALFGWQQWLIYGRDRERCFRAFGSNTWAGLALFVGVVGQHWRWAS